MIKDVEINTKSLTTLIEDIYDRFDDLEKDNEEVNLKWTVEGKSKSQQALIMTSFFENIQKKKGLSDHLVEKLQNDKFKLTREIDKLKNEIAVLEQVYDNIQHKYLSVGRGIDSIHSVLKRLAFDDKHQVFKDDLLVKLWKIKSDWY
jgi:SMC interacting uncharacterized protein involved in chromosome segregation|tara:strand:- start:2047 stop:2487 length:441 start_codon:yes stop_codon:yes gene_type:complete